TRAGRGRGRAVVRRHLHARGAYHRAGRRSRAWHTRACIVVDGCDDRVYRLPPALRDLAEAGQPASGTTPMIPLRDQELLKQRLAAQITSRIRIDFFSQKPTNVIIPGRIECALCPEIQTLLEELASLNDRISLSQHFIEDAPALAESLGVDKIPAIVVR